MEKLDNDEFVKVAQLEHTRSGATRKLDAQAQVAREASHTLRPLDAIRAYPKAIFWSLMVSMCVVMEGYDWTLMGNFFAYPQFAERYGQFVDENGNHQLSASWQVGLSNASAAGCFIGSIINGYLVTRFGQKRIILTALAVLSAFIFVTFFARNIHMLLVGQLLCGLPWGVFVTSSPAYASEVLPMSLRVYFTSWTNMCFIIGQLIAAGVLAGLVNRPDQWAYRIPFALQWMWPLILLPILSFAPESPWHLVRCGRLEEAKRALARLQSKTTPELSIESALAEIVHTNNTEIELSSGTRYMDCFKGTELRRTEIACVAFAGQVLSGSSFAYNSTYFFQQVGLSSDQTYYLALGGMSLALFGAFVSWFAVMPYIGRRLTYLCGMFVMFTTLLIIGILNVWNQRQGVDYTQAVLTLVWTLVYQLTVGQLGWSIPSEIGSTRLRQKTICLARNSYYIVATISGIIQPYVMNPRELNLGGYTGFIWGATGFLVFVWAFFRLPESKGHTFEELDWLFASKTATRKFKMVKVSDFTKEGGEKVAVTV